MGDIMEIIIIGNENNFFDSLNKKSRAIILKNDEILVANYGGVYLLPGGKLDEYEDYKMALFRELKEELGWNLIAPDIDPYLIVKHYQDNFPTREGTIKNRLVITQYYLFNVLDNFEVKNNKLSESEKKDNFNLEFIKLDMLEDVIKNNNSVNPRKKYFDVELLEIVDHLNLKKQKVLKKQI